MGDGVGADLMGDGDLALGDQRTGDRRTEQILSFVKRIGAHHGEHIVGDEFLAQVVDEDMLRLDPEQLGGAPRRLQLLALAQVGGEGDDFASVGLPQPFQDDAGVEAAGESEHDTADGVAHGRFEPSRGTGRAGLATAIAAIQARYRIGRLPLVASGRVGGSR